MLRYRVYLLGVLIGIPLQITNSAAAWRPWNTLEYWRVRGLLAAGDTLWATGQGGVERSTDNGAHWSERATITTAYDYPKALIRVHGRLVAIQYRTICTSDDGGSRWTARDSIDIGVYYRLQMREDTLFAWSSIFGNDVPYQTRFSVDGGLTWREGSAIYVPAPSPPIEYGTDTFTVSRNSLLGPGPAGPDTLLTVVNGIVQVVATSRRLVVLTGEGICLASEDGRTGWTALNPGYAAAEIYDLAADSTLMAMRTPTGIYLSRDQGAGWEFAGLDAFATGESHGYLYLSAGTLFQWVSDRFPMHRYHSASGAWDTIEAPAGSRLFAAGDGLVAFANPDTLFLSTDGGLTYAKRTSLPAFYQYYPKTPGKVLQRLSIARNRIFLGANQDYAVSSDSGMTWTRFTWDCIPDYVQDMTQIGSAYYAWHLDPLGLGIGLYKLTGTGSCALDSLPAFPFPVSRVVQSGSTLFAVTWKGTWALESPAPIRMPRRDRSLAPSRPSPGHIPTPAWPAPGNGGWIDAKGAAISKPGGLP